MRGPVVLYLDNFFRVLLIFAAEATAINVRASRNFMMTDFSV